MDLFLCENGSGGDFLFINNDFVLTDGFSNQIYLAWFGGNTGGEESDREDVPQSEQRTDWWGNNLFFEQDLEFKFKSELETTLTNTELSSNGRLAIEDTAKADLDFLRDFGDVEIIATIPDVDTLKLTAKIQQPNNEENQTFTFIWDATRNEGDSQCDEYVQKTPFVQTGNYSFNYLSNNYNVI